MEDVVFKYIGTINIASLVDYIRTTGIEEGRTIKLHPNDFDDVVLDHRRVYSQPFSAPFKLLGVPIEEDQSGKAPLNRVMIINEHSELYSRNERVLIKDLPQDPRTEIIFRCGWCGNFVNENGELFDGETRQRKIELFETYKNREHRVNGQCCRNRW